MLWPCPAHLHVNLANAITGRLTNFAVFATPPFLRLGTRNQITVREQPRRSNRPNWSAPKEFSASPVIANDRDNFEVTFEGPVPAGLKVGDALENLTWSPDVTIRGCHFASNRARGALISIPGRVLIEKNRFESSGSAMLIAGDANYWYESGAVTDVTIRHNTFEAPCLALAGPDSDALKGDLRENDGKGVHFSGPGLRAHAACWVDKVAPWLEQLIGVLRQSPAEETGTLANLLANPSSEEPRALVRIDADAPSVPYSPMLFGGFIEHFDGQIYGGIFEPGSPLSDVRGYRQDVVAALKELMLSIVRWPGGCFASG
jgi:hypothetical protein